MPGPSAFYTTGEFVEASGLNAEALFKSLQVKPHPLYGYRPQVCEYTVQIEIRIPTGTAAANPLLGPGGAQQFFIHTFGENVLKPGTIINLIKYRCIDMKLSDDLLPIYNLEIKMGNEVVRIDEPAGTTCPFAIVFRDPIHFDAVSMELILKQSVDRWKNDDPHYPLEEGYYSLTTRHAIVGPQVPS